MSRGRRHSDAGLIDGDGKGERGKTARRRVASNSLSSFALAVPSSRTEPIRVPLHRPVLGRFLSHPHDRIPSPMRRTGRSARALSAAISAYAAAAALTLTSPPLATLDAQAPRVTPKG